MDACLNVLYDPKIFLPSAALIIVVLALWAQLSARGQNGGSFTLYLGFVWIYLAIFFALLAFGLHVLEFKRCAVGFFGLSFLMTIVHVLFSTLRKLLILIMHPPRRRFVQETALSVGTNYQKWLLFWAMVGAVAGLALVSFWAVGICGCCGFWVGVGLVLLASLIVLIMILKDFRCCVKLRWECWKIRHWCIRRIQKCREKRDEERRLTKHPHP